MKLKSIVIGSMVCAPALAAFLAINMAGKAEAQEPAPQQEEVGGPIESYTPWDPETVEIFRRIPVQDSGRIKPFDTLAQFRLFRLHGKRSMKFEVKTGPGKDDVEEVKIGPTEWMMDVLFRSELAQKLPTFQVNDSRVITSLGLKAHEERRDHYSYEEILPGRRKLSELGAEYAKMEDTERSYDKTQLLHLATNVSDFEYLNNQFDFAATGIPVEPGTLPEAVFPGAGDHISAIELIEKMGALRTYVAGDDAKITPGLEMAMRHLQFYADSSVRLEWFPPRDGEDDAWLSCGRVMMQCIEDEKVLPWGKERLELIGQLVNVAADQDAFKAEAEKLSALIVGDAKERGEYGKIETEVSFYDRNYFSWSRTFFIFGSILIAFTWLAPQSGFAGVLTKVVTGLSGVGLVSLTVGVFIRSLIQSRAPIYNLYDTILVITGVAVLVGLFLEYVNRQGLGLAMSVILGAAGMFLAMAFEVKNAADTMESMRAVLASNFWLSTHVTTVILGYAGGLLASGIAHYYLIARLLGVRKGDRKFYRSATRMVYGVICFSLFFALVGTVLGGIWANYSWGRFWGWDPKENGALMIVIWCLVILHARLGGYIRDLGINLCAIFGGIIVSFSWWGVNNLGVGLHSYGFTSGVWSALFSFWAFELIFFGIGAYLWMKERGDTGKSVKGGGKPVPQAG